MKQTFTSLKKYPAILLIFLITLIYLPAQTITSTTSGGDWGTPSTWIGNVVPGENNDVVIQGTVSVTNTLSCKNLTINSGGIIQNGGGLGWLYLKVLGNLTNNGTVRNNPTANALYIVAWGNVTNNGVWTNSGLMLPGKYVQYISQANGKYFDTEVTAKDDSGFSYSQANLFASTDLTFRKNLQLQGYLSGTGYTWTTLNMSGKSLTITGSCQLYYATIKNATSINIQEGARIVDATFEGNIELKGRGRIDNNGVTFKNDVVVTDTLQNGGGLGWLHVTIEGKLTNNGVIKNNDQANALEVEALGDVENNGIWKNSWTYFAGKSTQTIKQATGKYFDTEIRAKDASGFSYSSGKLIAGSDLSFKKNVNLQGYISGTGYVWTPIDMKNYNIYITGDCQFFYGVVKNASSISVNENARIVDTEFEGNVIMRGRGRIDNNGVVFKNDLTVADTLQNGGGLGWLTVYVEGNLINNGVIKNNDKANALAVEVKGNIENNGIWRNSWTYLPQKNVQYIKQSTGKYFDTEFYAKSYSGYTDTTGKIIAGSDLVFKKSVNLQGYVSGKGYRWCNLDANNYNITLAGSAGLFYGVLLNSKELNMLDDGRVYDFTFGSNVIFKGRGRLDNSGVTFLKNLTVIDTLQNGGGLGWLTPVVYGDLINYGYVKNNKAGNSLELDCRGNVYNYGKWENGWTHLKTGGSNRIISGNFNTIFYFYKSGTPAAGDIVVDGKFTSQKEIKMNDGVKISVNGGSEFYNNGGITGNGSVTNNGYFYSVHNLEWYDPLNAGLDATVIVKEKSTFKNVAVAYTVNAGHPTLSSSIKQWWRMKQDGKIGSYKLTLKYKDELLNGNNENSLEVFLSPDSGKSWKRISNPVNITRDAANNTITVGTDNNPITEGFGDIIISSGKIVAEPSISLAIGGRKQIRVGPPNIYTITYWNNNDYPTGKFFLKLNGTGGVHIKSIVSKEIATGKLKTIPIDSLTYNGVNNEVHLLVQELGAKEVRSFDVILGAVPTLGKSLEPITFAAVALWIGGAIIEEYISNTIVEGCYEMWRPVRHDESLMDASVKAVKNSMNKAVTIENGTQGIAKKAAEEIIEKTGRVAVWPVMLAKDVFDCLGNTVRGMKDYVNGNFDKKEKELEKVTSWDPNAKEGPTGYGSKGYLATLAPMTYTIFFENKKEATAAAWKIEIVDTLDEKVYDVSTLTFGKMSHTMGVPTRNGNIIKWVFENIELPPNITPPEGEGWVQFTIKTKPNLPTGTEIKNRAVITFDLNKPIATNVALNTLDFEAPVTTPVSVVQDYSRGVVKLKWSNNDGTGSGVQKSLIYMSVDDSPFTLARTATGDTASVSVQPLHKYKFFIISEDNVGNAEKESTKFLEILTDITDDEPVLPDQYYLAQNYPNPFNPVTTINYNLPKNTSVRLEIINVLGEKVISLVNQEQMSGRYTVKVDMSNYASGIYFYRIVTKDYSETKKMVLIK